MRLLFLAALLLAAPGVAQSQQPSAKMLWDRSKQLVCTDTHVKICENECRNLVPASARFDLAAKTYCEVGDACANKHAIGTVKVIDKVLLVYIDEDKDEPQVFRIWDDGRFTSLGILGKDKEGGLLVLGKCVGAPGR